MENFFWTAFGIFFILCSLIGLVAIILSIKKAICNQKKINQLKKIHKEDVNNKLPENDFKDK